MRRLSLTLLLAASCATRPPAAPAPELAERAPMAPVTVAIDVVSGAPEAGTRMEFRARLVKNGVWDAPIAVSYRVPLGATIAGGLPRATVVDGDGPGLQLDIATVPVDDLVLVADSQLEGAGFHAEARYRFGRPAPLRTGPEKSGPSLRAPGGADLGPSVPMN